MKIRCIAIDDEPPALEKLQKYIGRIPYLDLVATADNALDARDIVNSRGDIDAIFVDINMPDLSGLDFVESLDEPRPLIVFITAYAQYAVDSYRTGAVDYLLKPYGFDDLQRAAARLVERVNPLPPAPDSADNTFFVKVDNRWVKIHPERIEYIRGFGDYLRLYLTDRENPLVTYLTLNALRDLLPPDFIQVHRSYIVNMTHVSAIERTRVSTPANVDIPVGESFKDSLAAYLATRTVSKDSRRRPAHNPDS